MFFLITSSLFISLLYLLACIYVCLVFVFFYLSVQFYTSIPLLFFFFLLLAIRFFSLSLHKTLLLPAAFWRLSFHLHPSPPHSLPPLSLSIPSRQPSLPPSPPHPPPPPPPPPHSLSQPFTPFFCTWDLPNNKWLCPRSDKRSTAQEATATVSFIPFFFFLLSLLTAFELSLQHIIIITGDGNTEIRMQELKWREREREREREGERERERRGTG